jgi:hypothetical protein
MHAGKLLSVFYISFEMCAEASVSKMDIAKVREPIRSEMRKYGFPGMAQSLPG